MTSVLTGTALPFGLAKLGVDPANAGTSIQARLPVRFPQPTQGHILRNCQCLLLLVQDWTVLTPDSLISRDLFFGAIQSSTFLIVVLVLSSRCCKTSFAGN